MTLAVLGAPHEVVRRVTLAGAALWILLHAGHAVAFRGAHSEPLLLWTVLLLALAVQAAVLAPLFERRPGPSPLGPVLGYSLALFAVVVAAGVQPFLTPEGLVGYANWPMGGLCLLIAALTLRGRTDAAVLAAVGMIMVNTVTVWGLNAEHPEVGLTVALLQAVPPITWLVGTLALRRLLDRSQVTSEEYRRRQLDANAEAMVTQAVREDDDRRRAQLRTEVLPLLTVLAEHDGPVTEEQREEARQVAGVLRDSLKARSLLTTALQTEVRAARRRGVRVSLSCDGDDQPLLTATRAVLPTVLSHAPPGASVSCRVTDAPGAAVIVVADVDEAEGRTLAACVLDVCGRLPGVRVELQGPDPDAGDGLVVHLQHDRHSAPAGPA